MAILLSSDPTDSSFEAPSPSPPVTPFPLLSFPPEVVHNILLCLLQPPSSQSSSTTSSFPQGVSTDAFALSLTCRLLNNLVRPFSWRSVRYEPVDYHSGVVSKGYRKRRGLAKLLEIMEEAKTRGRGIRIKLLSFCLLSERYESTLAYELELSLMIQIVSLNSDSLEVLFLEGTEMPKSELGTTLMGIIAESRKLSALRFNQCDLGPLRSLEGMGSFERLRSLQIMHGSRRLMDLVFQSPSLESLLLWPESRRLNKLAPYIANTLLPKLRLLSLDAVNEPEAFLIAAKGIERLSKSHSPIPLTELFLEGYLPPSSRTILLSSLKHTNLKRLALYHLKEVRPELIREISSAVQGLEGLTLVMGDTGAPVDWPAPLSEYTSALSSLPFLQFFASDRSNPSGPLPPSFPPPPTPRHNLSEREIMKAEFKALSKIGENCKALREAVGIWHDVSEGCTGYFATFTPETDSSTAANGIVGRTVSVRRRTVKDFLIGFDRWCVVEA